MFYVVLSIEGFAFTSFRILSDLLELDEVFEFYESLVSFDFDNFFTSGICPLYKICVENEFINFDLEFLSC